VIHLKGDMWIVKDNFKSDAPHTYKQVWQGHYSMERAPNLLRSSFSDGSGSDIYQLVSTDSVGTDGKNGKEWSVVSKNNKSTYSFVTAIVPFRKFDDRIDEDKKNPSLKGWEVNKSKWTVEGSDPISLTKENASVFFAVKKLAFNGTQINFTTEADVFLKQEKNKLTIQILSANEVQMTYTKQKTKNTVVVKPGEIVNIELK
jgi:hypothetical protein